MVYVTASLYNLPVAILSVSIAGEAALFLFFITAYWGKFHKIRKDQDPRLMHLLALGAFCATLQNAGALLTLSLPLNAGISCNVVQRIGNAFHPLTKACFYFFLVRKGENVQYQHNASKWSFRAVNAAILFYVVYLFVVNQGAVVIKDVFIPGYPVRFCVMSFPTIVAAGVVAFELIVSIWTLYLFIKPLRSHMQEVKGSKNSVGSTPSALSNVLSRNLKGSAVAIATTFVVFFIIFATGSSQDWAFTRFVSSLSHVDNLIGICSLVYVCHNAWEFPPAFTGNRIASSLFGLRSSQHMETSTGGAATGKAVTSV